MTLLEAEIPRSQVNRKSVDLIVSAALACGVFLSGFIIRDPAPYELFMAALMAVWLLLGFRYSQSLLPLLILLVLYNIGGVIAMTQMEKLYDTPTYLAITLFLSFTSVFFAALIRTRPDLYRVIFHAYVAAALGTTLLGIAGYFGLFPGAEIFTRYGRATGAFQDPNVFGPFLILPSLYLVHRILVGRTLELPLLAIPMLLLAAGIFLSFSRGAWGLFAFAIMMLVATMFLQNNSGLHRIRILVLSGVAVFVLAAAVVVALQIPAIAELFSERAKLVQDYDSWRFGRFARYAIGFPLAMENPFGLGGPRVRSGLWRRYPQHLAEGSDRLLLARICCLCDPDLLDTGCRLQNPAPRAAVATVPALRVYHVFGSHRAGHHHRHGSLAAFLPVARTGVGRNCA